MIGRVSSHTARGGHVARSEGSMPFGLMCQAMRVSIDVISTPAQLSGWMTRLIASIAAFITLCVLLLACGDISATNPYDPGTPAAQQAPATVSGAIRLYDENHPEAVFDAERLSTGAIFLVTAGAAVDVQAQQAPDSKGAFLFENVPSGDYVVRAHVDGFQDVERPFHLEIGLDYKLGELALPAISNAESVGYLVGKAQRSDAPAGGHGGIRVQVLGTPWQAETDDDGAYRVAVSPGLYNLSFASAGYGTEGATDLRAVAGQDVAVPDALLHSRPGSVVGEVVLTSPDGEHMFTDADRLAVALTLVDLDHAEAEPILGSPLADGRFTFEGVPAGHYALSADAVGFLGAQTSADVQAGEARNVGAIHLEARIDARLSGVARRRCPPGDENCTHGGILVEAEGKPFVTVTGSDGHYLLSVSTGPYTLRYSLEGHTPIERQIDATLGENVLEDVELIPLPSTVDGPVVSEGSDGAGLDGAEVSVGARAADGTFAALLTQPSGADGAVHFDVTAAPGNYTVRIHHDRRVDAELPIALQPGHTAAFGRVALALQTGRLTGHVRRSDGGQRGGATLLLTGDPADEITRGHTVRAATSPPDDAFEVGLPAGAWSVTPLADDYITPQPTPVVVVPEGAPPGDAVELPLQHRTHEVAVPPVLGRDSVATFTRDPDLTFGRAWWDVDDPPEDLVRSPFLPLSGPDADQLPFDVGDENRTYMLHFQLANAAFLDDPSDPYAAISPTLTALATLDTAPPEISRVEIAGGSPEVHSVIVPVTIEATGAASVAVWNAPDLGCAGAPVCGQEAMLPFTGTVVHTLDDSKVDQDQTVCWEVCDDVCNCTAPAGATTRLGTFRDRPTPRLDSLSPAGIEVHETVLVDSEYTPVDPAHPERAVGATHEATPIRLQGTGIAYDTVAVVDAIELHCIRPVGQGRGCRADDVATCLDTCLIDLSSPEAGALRDNAGTHAVRLRTPDPVVNGEAMSDPQFLTVSTQLPIIESMSPRGITVADLSDPDLRGLMEDSDFAGIDFSRVFPANVAIRLRVCRDANNAQFRLGDNVGSIDAATDTQNHRVPADPGSPCAGFGVRTLTAAFSTERLLDLSESERVVGVLNPSPGGGLGTAKFGITNAVDNCMANETCIASLTSRRPLTGDNDSTFFVSRTNFSHQFAGLAWQGGDAGALHWRYRVEDVPGVVDGSHLLSPAVARVTPETAGGVLPAILGQPYAVTVADTQGVQPQVELHPVSQRNDGRFAAANTPVAGNIGRGPQDVLVEDFNADGNLDAVVSSCVGNQLTVRFGPLDNPAVGVVGLPTQVCPTVLAHADFDSDGLQDLAALIQHPGGVSVRLGRPGGAFSLPVNSATQRSPRALAVADFDKDGNVDLLTASDVFDVEPIDNVFQDPEAEPLPAGSKVARMFIRWGRGTRGFTLPYAVVLPLRPGVDVDPDPRVTAIGADHLVVADVDLDGIVDVVAGQGEVFRVLRGTGDRNAPFAWFSAARDQAVRAGQAVTALAVGDLDADGRPDLIASTADDDPDPDVHSGTVLTWLGQGDGAFVRAGSTDLDETTSLSIGDLSGDGRPDVAVMDRTGTVERLTGLGDGRFWPVVAAQAVALSDDAGHFAVADMDRDGAQDLIGYTQHAGPAALSVRKGLGRQAFGLPHAPLATGAGPVGTVLMDFDQDGNVDLVSLDEEGQSVTFFHGDGRGGFTTPIAPMATRIAVDLYPSDGLAEDLDGDGWTDLIVTDVGGRKRQVLRGTGRGTFAKDTLAELQPWQGYFNPHAACFGPVFPRQRLIAVDLDGDGTRELLEGEGGDLYRAGVYTGSSSFQDERSLGFNSDCGAGFTVWDLNGSLRPVAFSGGTVNVDVLMPEGLTTIFPLRLSTAIPGLGGPLAWQRIVAAGNPAAWQDYIMYGNGLETADFDADGRDDLLVFGQVADHRYSILFHPPGHAVLNQLAVELAAINGWLDKTEGTGLLRMEPRLADFNGDGQPDEAGVFPELGVANIRLRRAPETGYTDEDELLPIARAVSQGLETGDLNHDGVPDLAIANQQDDSLSVWELPGPGEWTLALGDPQQVPVALMSPTPPGGRADVARVRQAYQTVDQIAVVTHIDAPNGGGLDGVTLSLRSPAGQVVTLGHGPARGDWRGYFNAPGVDFTDMLGGQPTGDWVLEADVGAGVVATLRDLRVITHGAFVLPQPGSSAKHPRPVAFAVGATGRALRDTTLGATDSVDLTCAATGGGQPDRFFEGTLPVATHVTVQLSAGFDAAVEIRSGTCGQNGPVRNCGTGRSARLGPLAMDAGPFCIIVDGVDRGLVGGQPRIHSGGFDLFVSTSDAAPDPCANGGCPDAAVPDAAVVVDAAVVDAGVPPAQDAGVAGEVACGASVCQGLCCVGFLGAHCAAACNFIELPATCDGPEDCGGGQQCCADQATGAHCGSCAANQVEVCHRDSECSAGSCIACPFPGVGTLQMCRVGGCP